MESVLRDPAVCTVGLQSLDELSRLLGLLGHAEVAFGVHGPGTSPDPFYIITRTRKGLLVRASLDLGAMAALSANADFHTVIAGNCRCVYEACCWVDVVTNPCHGARAALIYQYHHERLLGERGRPVRLRLARMLTPTNTGSDDENVVRLAPTARRAVAALREADQGVDDDLRALAADWFGPDARTNKGKLIDWLARPVNPARAGEASGVDIEDVLWDFWGSMIYEPACRILHVADALDFVTEGSRYGAVDARPRPEFGHHAATPAVVIAALVMRTLHTVESIGLTILETFPPGQDDDEVADETRFLKDVAPLVRTVAEACVKRWGSV